MHVSKRSLFGCLIFYDYTNQGCAGGGFSSGAGRGGAFQLQKYQTDVGSCRFDTLGKLTPAHSAGPPTVHGLWVCSARWVSAFLTAAGPPTVRGTFYCP